ncbi:MAG: hypothetical protein KDD89_01905, partial [Anaerolineales bacterium]|nr:hypothetical protein [Anaerolineales bacterium]
VGAVATLLILLGVGWWWNTAVQATQLPPAPEAEPLALSTDVSKTSATSIPISPPPTIALTEQSSPPPVSSISLPQETDDPLVILAALELLAEQEQKIILPTGGWYHLETTFYWPNLSSSSTQFNSTNSDASLAQDQIIPPKAWSRVFLRYTPDKAVVEGISIYGDYETGQINQLSVLDNTQWTNVTLKQAGFTTSEYRTPLDDNPFTFPTESTLADFTGLIQSNEKSSWHAYQKDGLFVIEMTYYFKEPTSAVDVSAPMVAKEEIRSFDIATGQLIHHEGYAELENGDKELVFVYDLLAQETVSKLPQDVENLYGQTLKEDY